MLWFFFFSAFANKDDTSLSIKRFTEINEYSLRIELNTAPTVRFELIPGIGAAMAAKIDNYRKNVKIFDNVDELMKIKGIGKATVSKMRPFVYILKREPKKADKNTDD